MYIALNVCTIECATLHLCYTLCTFLFAQLVAYRQRCLNLDLECAHLHRQQVTMVTQLMVHVLWREKHGYLRIAL